MTKDAAQRRTTHCIYFVAMGTLLFTKPSNMVGASRLERPTTPTPRECATKLRHAPKPCLLQHGENYLQFIDHFLDNGGVIVGLLLESLPGPSDSKPFLIKHLLNLQSSIYILLFIDPLPSPILSRGQHREFRLPVSQHIRL